MTARWDQPHPDVVDAHLRAAYEAGFAAAREAAAKVAQEWIDDASPVEVLLRRLRAITPEEPRT